MDKPLSYFEMYEIVSAGGTLFLPDRIVRTIEDIPPDPEMERAKAEADALRAEAVANGHAPAVWQILIVTLRTRRHWLSRLMGQLAPQLVPGVEIVTMEDDGERPIGLKRQQMLEAATADYVCFFDDDDLPASDYVARILPLLTSDDPPDIVGWRLRYFVDGKQQALAVHSYNANRAEWPAMPRGWRRYERLPNHLNAVRRELALKVGYRPLNTGEDGDYAKRLAQLRPRPREAFIPSDAYDYLYRSRRTGEVTNELRMAKGR